MADTQGPMKRVTDVVPLCLGNLVEVLLKEGQHIYYSKVKFIDFRHGFLWIRHGALTERSLLDVSECEIWWRPFEAPSIVRCAVPGHSAGTSKAASCVA
jgi:hypothetical protein